VLLLAPQFSIAVVLSNFIKPILFQHYQLKMLNKDGSYLSGAGTNLFNQLIGVWIFRWLTNRIHAIPLPEFKEQA
jgi:hypothetical protein